MTILSERIRIAIGEDPRTHGTDDMREWQSDAEKLEGSLADAAVKIRSLLAYLTPAERAEFWSGESARNLKR